MSRCQNTAYDLQNDNTFELAKMFKEATLESVKTRGFSHQQFLNELTEYSEIIEEYIKELQSTKPILPITKLPKASIVNSKITAVNEDYSTNLKGVYKKDGLTIIRYNEVEDWEAIGFPKGSISSRNNLGTIKFITHWVYNTDSIANFQEFSLPDSDVLLSASYLHTPESKALKSGLLLDVATENIHGGDNSDTYSGNKKTLTDFKKKVFKKYYSGNDRDFFANLVKKELGYDDEEYRAFVKKNANKSMAEIEPEKIRNSLIQAYSSVYTGSSLGDYNEIYVSNAKIQGCYTSTWKSNHNTDTITFVDKQDDYLKDYAKQNDLLFFVFGD